MIFLFHTCDKKPRLGRWWFGLLLVAALCLPGCKQWGLHDDEGLRRNDLSEPARQVRAKANPEKETPPKPADDPWMSDKAQRVWRDLD